MPERLRRNVPAATAAALAVFGLVACSEPSSTATPPAVASEAPTPSPAPSIVIPEYPTAETGYTTLAQSALRHGGSTVASISVKPGEVLVTILCTGGTMVVHMEPIATSTIPCAVDSMTLSRNSYNLGSGKDVNISVEAGPTVQWNLRVEQK